jgi:hypothetical protein
MRPDELERRLVNGSMRSALQAAPSCSTSSCFPTSSGPTQSAPIGGNPTTRTFAELLIDCEEDRILRAVLVGMLREVDW